MGNGERDVVEKKKNNADNAPVVDVPRRTFNASRRVAWRRGATRGDLRRDPELICRLIADSWHPRDFTGRETRRPPTRHKARRGLMQRHACPLPAFSLPSHFVISRSRFAAWVCISRMIYPVDAPIGNFARISRNTMTGTRCSDGGCFRGNNGLSWQRGEVSGCPLNNCFN